MKKIVILCMGLAAVLALCFLDGTAQRQRALETSAAPQKETKEETGQEQNEEAPQQEMGGRDIRVLIKSAGFASEYHDRVTVESAAGFTAEGETRSWETAAGRETTFEASDALFADGGALTLRSKDGRFTIRDLMRGRTSEVYEGCLELHGTQQGLLLINVLPLEDYLMGVVSSEMPSSYPEEALKAQAVCARTYACLRMQEQSASAYFADVDDSVSYQVYNNQERTQETDLAVRETAGEVLKKDGSLIEAMYYSTSCGLDVNLDLSGEAVFAAVLQEDGIRALESEEPWYRWSADIRLDQLENAAELEVTERRANGAADALTVTDAAGGQRTVEGEYAIREFLAGAHPAVTLQNEETMEDLSLLPSAFFILQPLYENGQLSGYHVLGGGYGHGVGMSQNGAKQMALAGMDYRAILHKYYGEDVLIS